MKTIHVRYGQLLGDQRGANEESVLTYATSPEELYRELRLIYRFSVSPSALETAVNEEFVLPNTPLWEGDTVTFIPSLATTS